MYNWAKKKPAFITIEDEGYTCESAKVVSGGTLLMKKVRGKVIVDDTGKLSAPWPGLDIRSERMDADELSRSESLEEDGEFITPREHFGSSGKKAAELHENSASGPDSLEKARDGMRSKTKSREIHVGK